MNNLLNFNLGKDAEIDSITPDGKYLIRYSKANGSINMIAWSEEGPNENIESDVNGKRIVQMLQNEITRRRQLQKN